MKPADAPIQYPIRQAPTERSNPEIEVSTHPALDVCPASAAGNAIPSTRRYRLVTGWMYPPAHKPVERFNCKLMRGDAPTGTADTTGAVDDTLGKTAVL